MIDVFDLILLAMTQVEGAAPAVPPPAAAPAPAAAAPSSVWDFALKGGLMMIPLAACSLIVLAVTAERLITLRRRSIVPPEFYPALKRILESRPVDRADALHHAEGSASPIARVLAPAIRRLGRPPHEVKEKLIEAGEHEIAQLRRRTRALSVIASIAPLLGLTGTIFGMIKAFQTVAFSGEALGRTEMLATGIYEAMITTAAGLLVAIPALIAYNWIMARIERAAQHMSEIGSDFVESFAVPAAAEAAAVSPARATPAPVEVEAE